jgi:hypothetical protein
LHGGDIGSYNDSWTGNGSGSYAGDGTNTSSTSNGGSGGGNDAQQQPPPSSGGSGGGGGTDAYEFVAFILWYVMIGHTRMFGSKIDNGNESQTGSPLGNRTHIYGATLRLSYLVIAGTFFSFCAASSRRASRTGDGG